MHGLGHIYRDLKSGNVSVTETMQAKVADFGWISWPPADGAADRAIVVSCLH